MPEMEHVKTTMDGPASRRNMFSTDLDDDGAVVEDEHDGAEETGEQGAAGSSDAVQGAAATARGSDAPQLAANTGDDAAQLASDESGPANVETNAHETIRIRSRRPGRLRMFEAL